MTTSVVLTLSDVWLSDALNPSDAYVVEAVGLSDTVAVQGGVRNYAGGRQRAVTTEGSQREVDLQVQLQDAATVAWLQGKLGQLLLLRDPFGLKVFGTIFALPRGQHTFAAYSDFTVKFSRLTHSEEV